jgi:UDP-2,3-diacylglucosamine hydrolase
MQCGYFVSDIHITLPGHPRTGLFTAFLRTLSGGRNVSHLFLMGDVFDLWLADHRYFVDKYQSVIDEILRLRDEGVEIHYFEGNHDLHLRYYWADRLGLTVHNGPIYVELCKQTLRLEHGDEMDPDDRGYRFLRWFLRTPPIRFLICHLPGALIVRIGERASATSRTYTTETKTIADVDAVTKIRAHAMRAYAAKPFDIIISGHVHIRDDHIFRDGTKKFRSINLGTWLDAPCYFKIDESGNRLFELSGSDMAQLT